MVKKIKNDIKKYHMLIIGVLLYFVILQLLFHDVCIFKIFLGIKCPCCGLTHATYYMFTGRFKEAIYANWTVFFWWIFIILFFIDRYIKKIIIKPIPYVLIIVSVITIIRYLTRIILVFL